MFFKKKASISEMAIVLCEMTLSGSYSSMVEQTDHVREKSLHNFKDTVPKKAAIVEFMVLQMFATTTVIREKFDDEISTQVLNAFHDCVAMRLLKTKQDIVAFHSHLNERYENYFDALKNQAGGGPMWHLGRVLMKNAFGDNPGDLKGPILGASLFAEWRKAVAALVADYKVTS